MDSEAIDNNERDHSGAGFEKAAACLVMLLACMLAGALVFTGLLTTHANRLDAGMNAVAVSRGGS